ncbi:hypothetical protein D3C75_1232880 [compost metagenome]
MHGTVNGKGLRLPVFDDDALFAAKHVFPLAVMQVLAGLFIRDLFRENVDIIAKTGGSSP